MEHNRSPQEGGGVDGVRGAGLNSLSVRGLGSEGTLSNKRCQVKPTLLMKCVSPAGLRRSANRERNTHREKPDKKKNICTLSQDSRLQNFIRHMLMPDVQ